MSDGIWIDGTSETVQQELMREKVIRVNTVAPVAGDVSGYASLTPGSTAMANVAPQGGPHFVLSPKTPDGRPTLGFEFCLLSLLPAGGLGAAVAGVGGFTVTVWRLIANASTPISPRWAAFASLTGVFFNQLYRTFDVNTCAIRFEIDNVGTDGSLFIAVTEL